MEWAKESFPHIHFILMDRFTLFRRTEVDEQEVD